MTDPLSGIPARHRPDKPSEAELRAAVRELAEAARKGLSRMREMRELFDEPSLQVIVLADDIDIADCALEYHAAVIAACQEEG